MRFDRDRHHRRSIRRRGYDYAKAGAYFVTICEIHRECIFGVVRDGEMVLNGLGEIVRDEWLRTPIVRSNMHLDEFVVMPNHFHAILVIDYAVASNAIVGANDPFAPPDTTHGANHRFAPTDKTPAMPHAPARNSVGAVMMQFKSIVAKRINAARGTAGNRVFQRDYHDHIIRNDREWKAIAGYIRDNPGNWRDDPDNPVNGVVPSRDYWRDAGCDRA